MPYNILVLGAALRFYRAGQLPAGWWYDEVNLARAIQDLVLDPGRAPLYVGQQVENPGVWLWIGAAFFKAFARRLQAMSLADVKTYLRWQLASSLAPALDDGFVQANFDFYGRTLTGQPQLKARWKRCVQLVDAQLGEALGQEFVARNFTPELKAATVQMTDEIEALYRDVLAARRG